MQVPENPYGKVSSSNGDITMKYTLLGIAAFFLTNLAPAPTLAQPQRAPQRALEVSIFGIGPGVDAKALRAVRSVIGKAVAEGVVNTYITYGYGIEGGMASCIQLSRYQNSEKLTQLRRELLQIMPDRSTTSYVVKVVTACTYPPRSSVRTSEGIVNFAHLGNR